MASALLLMIFGASSITSFVLCVALGWRDTRRGIRKFGKQSLLTGAFLALAFCVIVLGHFIVRSSQPIPFGTTLHFSIVGLLFSGGIVFLVSTLAGSFGYAISYRIFKGRHIPAADSGGGAAQRVKETGNPYQPPSI